MSGAGGLNTSIGHFFWGTTANGQGVASHRPSLRGYHTASQSQSQTAQALVSPRAAPGCRAVELRQVDGCHTSASMQASSVIVLPVEQPRRDREGDGGGSRSVSGDELTTTVTTTQTAAGTTRPFATGSRRRLKEA